MYPMQKRVIRPVKFRQFTVFFADGSCDVFVANTKDWVGVALGRNQSQNLQSIIDVTDVETSC